MNPDESDNVIAAFTVEQAARLTVLSRRQLGAWDRSGFFSPSLINAGGGAYARLYSFRDLLSLKVLSQLRNEQRVSMSHLRDVKQALAHLGEDAWVKSTLYLLGKRVVIERDDATRHEAGSGQEVFQIPLRVVAGGMRDRIEELNRRGDSEIGKIERKRGVMQNQALISGTRISVSSIKEFANAGYSVSEILNEYPSLSEEDVKAAISHPEERSAA